MITKEIENFYYDNQENLDNLFNDYVIKNDLGGFGLDTINITDEIFWDFVEDQFEKSKVE